MADLARRVHPTLAVNYDLSSDIFPAFFDWFFDDPVYDRWSRKDAKWQLHCIGGPGSGKTTLASLVTTHLVERYRLSKVAVVSLFFRSYVEFNEVSVFEDILVAIFRQLQPFSTDDSNVLFERYERERYQEEGCRSTRRIQLLRDVLYLLLSKLPKNIRTFLILDGIDLCNSALKILLEVELLKMQDMNVSVMLTSRIQVFEKQRRYRCDHINHGNMPDDDPLEPDERENLDLFWKCKICGNILCFECREDGRSCKECHFNDHLHEPYDHQNINIDLVPRQNMESFISWDLERENGDLGLGSSCELSELPPHSSLGRSILEDATSARAFSLVEDIFEYSCGNIAIAKARLDLVHSAESWTELDAYKRRHRLPANILSMFDAGVARIQCHRSERQHLGVKAIAALCKGEEIPISIMRRWLSYSNPDFLRSGEEIIDAAGGFLCAVPGAGGQDLCAYHNHFFKYVTNQYNKAIYLALAQIELEQQSPRVDKTNALPDLLRDTPTTIWPGTPSTPPSSDVRFEPINLSETPTQVTQKKLARTVTMSLDPIEENSHIQTFVRKGTRKWI